MSGRSKPIPGDLASAVLIAHGLVMNGGVLHAVEVLEPIELEAAIAGYERFGFLDAGRILERARTLSDLDKDAQEARLDREYAAEVPDDAALEAAMDRVSPSDSMGLQDAGGGVQDESDEVLIETYRVAASNHLRATKSGNPRAANRAHAQLALAYRTLRARGLVSQAKLLDLLRDGDLGVRTWAAAHALEFSPEAGEPVLVELAAQPGLVGFEARMTLKEWRAGRLTFP